MNKNNNVIVVKNLHKVFKSGESKLEVLKGISLEIHEGEILAIVGDSGSGKSTFLNMLGGLDHPTQGSIQIMNKDITKMDEEHLTNIRNKLIGFVFQFHNLLLDFTALENVMLPYLAKDYNWKEARKSALELLNDVGLGNRVDHKPGELSGGEQQRVAVARALINKPRIILADEPTGNLDLENSEHIRKLLWNMANKYKVTLVVVTHNVEIASKANRILTLDYGLLKQNKD